jgi:hypothetical protein
MAMDGEHPILPPPKSAKAAQILPQLMNLVRVVAPHFVAGFETDGIVRRAAPIIKYMVGWTDDAVRDYVRKKGWKAAIVQAATR